MKRSGWLLLVYCFIIHGYAYAQHRDWRTISGAVYDWTKTGKPETPYAYNYGQTLVMHLMLQPPEGTSKLRSTATHDTGLICTWVVIR